MSIADWPASWYPVSTTKNLPNGSVQVHQLGSHELVVARSESGVAFALDAYCPHMGAHLLHACVIGESLQCPLHHWRLPASGGAAGSDRPHRSWPVRELMGIVYVGFTDDMQHLPALPGEELRNQFYWTTGSATDVCADWKSAIVNGFDLTHLSTVHHRELLQEPVIDATDTRVQLNYQSRVTGKSLADRVTKWLSGDHIHVEQQCFGTTIVVRSQLKQISTAAIVSILPTAAGVRVFSIFGVKPGPLASIRGRLARELFTRFLRKDIKILEGMRMRLDRVDDAGVRSVVDFLGTLPEGPTATKQSPVGQKVSFLANGASARKVEQGLA